jgi:hypothetical protein
MRIPGYLQIVVSALIPGFLVFCLGLLSPLSARSADSIRSVVVDEQGKALAGVFWRISGLEVLRDGKWTFEIRSGDAPWNSTDNEGRFEITFREPLRYDLQFHKPGYAPAFLCEIGTNSPGLKVALKRGQILHGTVTRLVEGKRKPAVNEQVELRLPCRDLWYQERATTDHNGKFEFRVCAPPFEPRTPPGNILRGDGEPPRQWKWQVVFAGKVVQVDVNDGEPIKPVDFED